MIALWFFFREHAKQYFLFDDDNNSNVFFGYVTRRNKGSSEVELRGPSESSEAISGEKSMERSSAGNWKRLWQIYMHGRDGRDAGLWVVGACFSCTDEGGGWSEIGVMESWYWWQLGGGMGCRMEEVSSKIRYTYIRLTTLEYFYVFIFINHLL